MYGKDYLADTQKWTFPTALYHPLIACPISNNKHQWLEYESYLLYTI